LGKREGSTIPKERRDHVSIPSGAGRKRVRTRYSSGINRLRRGERAELGYVVLAQEKGSRNPFRERKKARFLQSFVDVGTSWLRSPTGEEVLSGRKRRERSGRVLVLEKIMSHHVHRRQKEGATLLREGKVYRRLPLRGRGSFRGGRKASMSTRGRKDEFLSATTSGALKGEGKENNPLGERIFPLFQGHGS